MLEPQHIGCVHQSFFFLVLLIMTCSSGSSAHHHQLMSMSGRTHVCDSADRAPLPLRLRGGSWLFTPKIVPVSQGEGGVVQWRQQPSLYDDEDDAEGGAGSASGGGVAEDTIETRRRGAASARGMPKVKAAAGGVQRTNDDSTASKASAARAGYFQDEYIERFVSKVPTRTALINRGYFARVQAVRSLVLGFLDACNARGQRSYFPPFQDFVQVRQHRQRIVSKNS
jgi:hypothetical protein